MEIKDLFVETRKSVVRYKARSEALYKQEKELKNELPTQITESMNI
ncbi:hypothetical protein [Bacillus toyonensis]